MFYCERCESKFNATIAASAGDCPRCKQSDDVASPLRFRLFQPSALKLAGLKPDPAGAPMAPSRAVK